MPLAVVCASALTSHLCRITDSSAAVLRQGIRLGKNPQKYAWVNFDIDTIYLPQHDLGELYAECPKVRRLFILGINSETFFYNYGGYLRDMKQLETVTILYKESPRDIDEEWWRVWDSIMESWYFTDDPVAFYAQILYPECSPYEINSGNYLKVERDFQRKLLADHPDWYLPDYQISDDSDEDYSAPGRFRRGYRRRVTRPV
ncbi:hypothetical protein CSOJ01_15997 [Colletotrichum sojae]|uniref:Uncharacterized protein n=1 Tax=Colletotrichum sojae TaxID=2175907 RepID=A0A8H6IKX2_9PEZI|nr:hypothetical protein CSOJ01_15997 [Colletotrichum sojae]